MRRLRLNQGVHELSRHPLSQRVLARIADLGYAWWKLRRPGQGYAAYYVHRVSINLGLGLPHPTLGGRGWDRGSDGQRTEWDRGSFADRARRMLPLLQGLGLREDMSCVDYGCGSLRVGQHVIGWLRPGAYLGLDVSDVFYKQGLELLDPEVVAAKQPRTAVIDAAVLDAVAAAPPDFVFCNAVVQHVPPLELKDFFDSFLRTIGPRTTGCLLFVSAPRLRHFGSMNWAYPPQSLVAAALASDPRLRIELREVNSAAEDKRGRARQALLIRRGGGDD